jgi:hypothetical protein
MPKLTDITIAQRQAQAIDVYKLMLAGETQKVACATVGISDDTFRRWIETSDEVTKAIGEVITYVEKQELLLINATRTKALELLLARMTDETPMETKDLIAALKFVHSLSDNLAIRHGATSDSEAAAAAYLRGPQLMAAESRMGGQKVVVTQEGNKTTVSLTKDEPDIIDVQ